MDRFNKKQKRLALIHTFASKIANKSVFVYENLELGSNKTKDYVNTFGKVFDKKVLFVDTKFQDNFRLASRNVSNVGNLLVDGVNVMDVFSSDVLCISKDAFVSVMERLKL